MTKLDNHSVISYRGKKLTVAKNTYDPFLNSSELLEHLFDLIFYDVFFILKKIAQKFLDGNDRKKKRYRNRIKTNINLPNRSKISFIQKLSAYIYICLSALSVEKPKFSNIHFSHLNFFPSKFFHGLQWIFSMKTNRFKFWDFLNFSPLIYFLWYISDWLWELNEIWWNLMKGVD